MSVAKSLTTKVLTAIVGGTSPVEVLKITVPKHARWALMPESATPWSRLTVMVGEDSTGTSIFSQGGFESVREADIISVETTTQKAKWVNDVL